jgi:hypothetical protein
VAELPDESSAELRGDRQNYAMVDIRDGAGRRGWAISVRQPYPLSLFGDGVVGATFAVPKSPVGHDGHLPPVGGGIADLSVVTSTSAGGYRSRR